MVTYLYFFTYSVVRNIKKKKYFQTNNYNKNTYFKQFTKYFAGTYFIFGKLKNYSKIYTINVLRCIFNVLYRPFRRKQ